MIGWAPSVSRPLTSTTIPRSFKAEVFKGQMEEGKVEEGKGKGYLAPSRQYGNALLGVRHQEEDGHLANKNSCFTRTRRKPAPDKWS